MGGHQRMFQKPVTRAEAHFSPPPPASRVPQRAFRWFLRASGFKVTADRSHRNNPRGTLSIIQHLLATHLLLPASRQIGLEEPEYGSCLPHVKGITSLANRDTVYDSGTHHSVPLGLGRLPLPFIRAATMSSSELDGPTSEPPFGSRSQDDDSTDGGSQYCPEYSSTGENSNNRSLRDAVHRTSREESDNNTDNNDMDNGGLDSPRAPRGQDAGSAAFRDQLDYFRCVYELDFEHGGDNGGPRNLDPGMSRELNPFFFLSTNDEVFRQDRTLEQIHRDNMAIAHTVDIFVVKVSIVCRFPSPQCHTD